MGSREGRQAALVRELERIKLVNRQVILNCIFFRLDYVDIEDNLNAELQDIADDLLLEKGKFTVDDLDEAIENKTIDPKQKSILKNLAQLLRL